MNVKEQKYDVGVIIGRFQTPILHASHCDLIDYVVKRHAKTIVFLGLSPAKSTIRNPYDFETRKIMLLEKYPNLNILYIKDTKEDAVWSKKLDEQIADLVGPRQTVVLYGGRDSFIKHYLGAYPTLELESESIVSSTEIRREFGNKVKGTQDFRHGVMWAMQNKYPTVYTTVDIGIYKKDPDGTFKILLARKPEEKQYRFVGGFADVKDDSFENTVRREALEETGLAIHDPEYIGSFKVDDWRYRAEADKIITNFFAATYMFGSPQPDDDICELRWFSLGDINPIKKYDDIAESPMLYELRNNLVENHKKLFDAFLKFLKGKVA